jgi:hypothetical protein
MSSPSTLVVSGYMAIIGERYFYVVETVPLPLSCVGSFRVKFIALGNTVCLMTMKARLDE